MNNRAIPYPLIITNTLSDTKEVLIPLVDKQISLYVCGVTPYDYSHIGHGRCYVTFDMLFRLLKLLGYQVAYCRNFTDIEDKIINKAENELGNKNAYMTIVNKFINAFHEDMAVLNCLSPTYEPRVTDNIAQIIDFIQQLITNGNAYVVGSDVYYSIESFPDYGKLSKREPEDLQAGARIHVREDKRNPLDFALWKKDNSSAPGWQSPWGWGRPGWHIECSALAKRYLGETIDLHGGGMDLIFPHHENEIAQSEGLHHKPLAHYWMHNAFVISNKEKMSKSLGNFVSLRDIFVQYNPMVIRYYLLSHHYRNPLEFSTSDIESYARSYQRLSIFFEPFIAHELTQEALTTCPLMQQLLQALCDDLNVAKLFGIVFDNLKILQNDTVQAGLVKMLLQQVLGLPFALLHEHEIVITPDMQKLIMQREEARKVKDWSRADFLREELRELGFKVQDAKLK